jgi:hypothetical protein
MSLLFQRGADELVHQLAVPRIFPKIAQDILSEMVSAVLLFIIFFFQFTISWKLPSRLKSQNNEISKLVGLLEIFRLTFSVVSSYVSNARLFHQMDDLCLSQIE